jgi:hypothetical protein
MYIQTPATIGHWLLALRCLYPGEGLLFHWRIAVGGYGRWCPSRSALSVLAGVGTSADSNGLPNCTADRTLSDSIPRSVRFLDEVVCASYPPDYEHSNPTCPASLSVLRRARTPGRMRRPHADSCGHGQRPFGGDRLKAAKLLPAAQIHGNSGRSVAPRAHPSL